MLDYVVNLILNQLHQAKIFHLLMFAPSTCNCVNIFYEDKEF